MKSLHKFLSLFLALVFVASASVASALAGTPDGDSPADKNVNWKKYSSSIVDGIRSENRGVRDASIRMAIQYSEKLDVSDATIDLMRIYRNSDSAQLRRLAAVALASIDSELAHGYLSLSKAYEVNDGVRKTIAALENR